MRMCSLGGPRTVQFGKGGFTFIEIAMVVLLIGLLAAIAFPAFQKARRKTSVIAVANDIKKFGDAFDLYSMERGGYPDDCHLPAPWHLPNEDMEVYLDKQKWAAITALGGNFNWEGPDAYPYAGIALFEASANADTLRELDEIIDDGDLATGFFRQTPNGRYTYILDE